MVTLSAPAPVLTVNLSTPAPSPMNERPMKTQSLPAPVVMFTAPRAWKLQPKTWSSSGPLKIEGPIFDKAIRCVITGSAAAMLMLMLLKLGMPTPPSNPK
jgi:hypothetical protein